MKLKKYNQYIKEDLTPMSGDIEDMTGGIEGGIVDQDDEFMGGDDASTLIGNNMNDDDQEEEEGNDASAWRGDQLLQQFAEIMGVEVADNQVSINGDVVTFAPETETFLINRKNTKVSDPHELVHKGFKGRDHKH